MDYSPPRPKAALRVEPADDGGRLLVSANDVEARHLLRRWLAASARRILTPQVERIAGETGLRPAAVSIRRQRTRWGSCTTRRQVNLNCAALFLTEALVEYLIVHELCHLRHMNHSRKFWSLVGTIVPDVRAREAALAASWNAVPGWVFYGGSAS